MTVWLPINTAPKNCRIIARKRNSSNYSTWYGKTSHVPLYGWCVGIDPEDIDLWESEEWLYGSEHTITPHGSYSDDRPAN